MNQATAEDAGDDAGKPEPPDPDVIDTDPSRRYVCYKEVLGKGAFKTVYRAFDAVDGIEVAWSQVAIDDLIHSEQHMERLHQEVHLLETLNHESIMKFYAWWIDDKKKTANIITELFTSGSLRQYRKKHKKVDMKAVKRWARQILSGLEYLHSQTPRVIHRDLKCDNIFINGNHGEVKIGDLGMAIIMKESNARSVTGTPQFMAPELYDEEYNELVDIYSFGMCILEMITFEYPYRECTNSAQIYKKVSSGIKPASLSKVKDPEVKAFIEKCLVPAASRLPARDLLKDPFLDFDGLHGSQRNESLHALGTIIPSVALFEDQSFASKDSLSSSQKVPFSMGVDGDENEPPVITVVENSASDCSRLITFEVKNGKTDNGLRLRGEKNHTHYIELKLQIADLKGPIRHSQFLFYLDNHTAILAAGKMVEQLELPNKDVNFMAELIDLLLVNLIHEWKPCVAIDHLVPLGASQSSMDETKDVQLLDHENSSIGSFQNIFDAATISGPSVCTDSTSIEDSIQPNTHTAIDMKLDDVEPEFNLESFFMAASDDRESEAPYFSAVSFEGANQRSLDMGYPLGTMDYDQEHKIRKTVSTVVNSVHHVQKYSGISDMSAISPFHNSTANGSSLNFINEDDYDKELKMDLEMIELQCQQAINDIHQKRLQAIVAARERAARRKLSLYY